eukprot:SAG31_NODE_1911_length_6936_cov_124.794501_7_plen_48_part_00
MIPTAKVKTEKMLDAATHAVEYLQLESTIEGLDMATADRAPIFNIER